MADQNSKVVLEIEVNDSGVVESARRTRKAYEDVNKHQVRGLKQQKENIKDVTKMKSKTEGPQALRKMLDATRRRVSAEKQILRTMKEQEAVAKRMMRSGGAAAGPLSIFGGQPGAQGFGGGLSGLMGARAGRGGRGAGRGIGGMLGGMGRGGMLAMARMLGPLGLLASGIGAVGSFAYGATSAKIRAGHGMHMQEQRALAGLAGGGTSRIAMERALNMGAGYGFSPMETYEQARGVARQTGNARAVTGAQAFSRASMMDVGETAGVMGAVARGGTAFGGTRTGAGEQTMQRIWSNIFSTGLDRSRFGEAAVGLGQVVDQVSARIGGDVNAAGIADLFGAMGSTGKSGLMGQRGISVLQQLGQAIQAPGGGEHGQALMLQALGFGKPGGDKSYYEAVRMQQEGLNRPQSVYDLFGETARQTGGEQEQALLLSRMTGLTISQVEELRTALAETAGLTQEERDSKITEKLKDMAPIEEQALEETKNMADLIQKMVEHELDTLRAGRQTSATLLSIQETTNEFVRQLIPLAQKILKALDSIYSFFVHSTFGSQEERNKLTSSKLDEIQYRYDTGELSEEEATAQMEELQKGQSRSVGKRKLRTTGSSARNLFTALSDTPMDLTKMPGFDDLSPEAKAAAKKYSDAVTDKNPGNDIAALQELQRSNMALQKEMAEKIILMSASVYELTAEQRATSSVPGNSVSPATVQTSPTYD